MRKTVLSVVAVIMALLGLLWFLQGIGIVGGSFMTNQIIWAIIGVVMVLGAAGVFYIGNRRTNV